ALTPILQISSDVTKCYTVYNALIHYIQAAQRLPVNLSTIEKAYAQTDALLRSSGRLAWRHELLVMAKELYCFRGMYARALSIAQEAWALRGMDGSGGYAGQVADFHFNGLVDICLRLRNGRAAMGYLREWEEYEDEMPVNREARLNRC